MTEDNKLLRTIEAKERGPGPGRYKLPSTCGYEGHDSTKTRKPGYLFGSRLTDAGEQFKKMASPGPVHFIPPIITRHGRDGTPSYSILGRQKDLKQFATPSPGAYSPEKVHPQGEAIAPSYSMRNRTRSRKVDSNPASSRYSLPPLLGTRQPTTRSCPSYSVTSRPYVGCYYEDLSKTPGPGQYQAVEPNVIRTRQPHYSLQGRSFMPGDNTRKPGPGAHSPEKVTKTSREAPKASIGIRHSEFVVPILTGSDL